MSLADAALIDKATLLQSSFLSLSSTYATSSAALQSTCQDVQDAVKRDGILRHRFTLSQARAYAHFAWIEASWRVRTSRAMLAYVGAEEFERSTLAYQLADLKEILEQVVATDGESERYEPPDLSALADKMPALIDMDTAAAHTPSGETPNAANAANADADATDATQAAPAQPDSPPDELDHIEI